MRGREWACWTVCLLIVLSAAACGNKRAPDARAVVRRAADHYSGVRRLAMTYNVTVTMSIPVGGNQRSRTRSFPYKLYFTVPDRLRMSYAGSKVLSFSLSDLRSRSTLAVSDPGFSPIVLASELLDGFQMASNSENLAYERRHKLADREVDVVLLTTSGLAIRLFVDQSGYLRRYECVKRSTEKAGPEAATLTWTFDLANETEKPPSPHDFFGR